MVLKMAQHREVDIVFLNKNRILVGRYHPFGRVGLGCRSEGTPSPDMDAVRERTGRCPAAVHV